jgi:hypothetical protein
MRFGSLPVKTPRLRSRASLVRVTRADQRRLVERPVAGFLLAALFLTEFLLAGFRVDALAMTNRRAKAFIP